MVNTFRELVVTGGVADKSMHVDVVGHQEDEGQEKLSSTPVKTGKATSHVADSVKFPSESTLKRSAGVAFLTIEVKKQMCEVNQSGKKEEVKRW